MENAKFIEVEAEVRYWEDASVNGKEDTDGTLIPCRQKNLWVPVIELATGRVQNWSLGMEAKIQYKVCDAGLYWLLDKDKNRIAKWKGYYVPNDILCVGNNGYGDYIIFNVDSHSLIVGWSTPNIDFEEWISV